MQCKQCGAEISIALAAESDRAIKRFGEAAGMTPEAVATFVSQRGPLCETCMEAWESSRHL